LAHRLLRLHCADRGHPLEVEPIRVELTLARGHERGRTGGAFDAIERLVEGVEKLLVEAVLAALHVQNEHFVSLLQLDHGSLLALGSGVGTLVPREMDRWLPRRAARYARSSLRTAS